MEGYRRKPRRDNVHREDCGVQDRSKIKDRNKGKAKAKKQGERAGTPRDIRGAKGRDRNQNALNRPMDYAKTLKLRFRVGDLDLPKKKRYQVYQ